jgi:hypothetical protein
MKKLFLILLIPAVCLAAPIQLIDGFAPLANDVLLVSDQTDEVTGSPPNYDEYYEDAIDDISGQPYSYDKLVHSAEITTTELNPYNMVVWYTGVSAPHPASGSKGHAALTLDEEDEVVNWLNNTPAGAVRGLWLSGRFIAFNCIADIGTEGQIYSELFSGYLGLDYPHDNFPSPITVTSDWTGGSGAAWAPMWGYAKDIYWLDDNYPDMLGSTGMAWDALMWTDTNNTDHHASMIANAGTSANGGVWKVVLSSLPLECMGSDYERSQTMNDILSWFGSTSAIEEITWGQIKALDL